MASRPKVNSVCVWALEPLNSGKIRALFDELYDEFYNNGGITVLDIGLDFNREKWVNICQCALIAEKVLHYDFDNSRVRIFVDRESVFHFGVRGMLFEEQVMFFVEDGGVPS